MAEEQREMNPAFAELLNDIQANMNRADKAKALETRHELAEYVWPMFQAIMEATNTRFEEIEDAVEEFLAEDGNVIYSDLAQPLFGLITLSRKIAGDLLSGEMNDLKLKQLRTDAQVLLDTVNIVEPLAAAALVEDAEEEDGGDDGDDDGGGDEGEEEDATEQEGA